MNNPTQTTNTNTGGLRGATVAVPTAPEMPEMPEVSEAELDAAAAALDYAEDRDAREAALVALEAAAWVRAHPDRADEALALAVAAAGLQPRVAWAPLAADAAATGVAVWGVLSGRLAELADSTGWPHVAWLLAGAIALALLTSTAEDIHHCYRAARQARRTRLAEAELAGHDRAGHDGAEDDGATGEGA